MTVYFKQEHVPTVQGVVVKPPAVEPMLAATGGSMIPQHWEWWAGNWSNPYRYVTQRGGGALVLENEGKRLLIDPTSVAYLQVDEQPEHPSERQPVRRVAIDAAERGEVELSILYLTKGATWAPSYSLDMTDSAQLSLRQKAVIRNELEDIDSAEIMLISGFPNIEFGHVLSPVAPVMNLANFFRALSAENPRSSPPVMSQTVMGNAAQASGEAFAGANPSLSGDDLHYHSIGRRTLALGDTLVIDTARATAEYESIVQWAQPDDRDIWGRRTAARYNSNSTRTMDQPAPWDAIRFRNPLDRPMTTAPAVIVNDGLVRGQSMLHWTAPGERNVLRINQALSVRAMVDEVELEGQRQEHPMSGRMYRRSTVQGTFRATNQRAEAITLVASIDFSGDLIETEGEPAVELRGEGVWSINPRGRMIWTLELAPGETREIKYTYHVLAPD